MQSNHIRHILAFILVFFNILAFGQEGSNPKAPADEQAIMETKWRYTYALHVESNTIIHQAENFYDFYLFFRFDHTYEQYLNGQLSEGNWAVKGQTLQYSFKNIPSFEIAQVDNDKMILEFTQPNAKGTYQYHFVRVETKNAPFLRRWNELPEVQVEAEAPQRDGEKTGWWVFGKKRKGKKDKQAENEASLQPYINIELIGGGYYGGIDPVLRDFIHIKSDGRLIKEFKSVQNGLIVTKKNMPREEVLKLVQYAEENGFFEFERMYDCQTAICQKRKELKPTPIPLRLAITLGTRRKVITISIWGKDENNIRYIDYPSLLDELIDQIQKMGHRPEESVVGK